MVYLLFQDELNECARVKAVFDHDPTEEDISYVVGNREHKLKFYVVETQLNEAI